VDDRNVRLVGRASPVIDAWAEGAADLTSARVTYGEPRLLELVQEHAKRLGPKKFVELTGLKRWAAERASSGKSISAANIAKALRALGEDEPRRCALDGCEHEVTSPRAKFCRCTSHGDHGDLYRHRLKRASARKGGRP
jgi:hypothetical protein